MSTDAQFSSVHSRGKGFGSAGFKVQRTVELQLDVALAGDLLQLVGELVLAGVALVEGEPDAEGGRQRADRTAPQVGGRHHLPPQDLGAARIKGFTAEAVLVQDGGKTSPGACACRPGSSCRSSAPRGTSVVLWHPRR